MKMSKKKLGKKKLGGMSQWYLLAMAICSAFLPSASCLALSHWDLEGANMTCDGNSICENSSRSRVMETMDWKERNCLCDALCAQYGDCCLDAAYFVAAQQRRSSASFSCVDLPKYGGIYMRTSCPPEWIDSKIRSLCEADEDSELFLSDPLSFMPVTSHKTRLTYKNTHCARCHKDLFTDSADMWNPRIQCPDLHLKYNLNQSEAMTLLIYKPENRSWGLNLTDMGFKLCTIEADMPETSSDFVRRCQTDIVRTCAVNWTNADVRNRCEAYTSLVYNGANGYRNPHCAICNNIPVQYLSCIRTQVRASFDRGWSPAAFAMLFDVSDRSPHGDDQAVGLKRACPDHTQLYDPFFKRCRTLICNENQIFSDGHCLPKSESNSTSSTEKPHFSGLGNTSATDKSDIVNDNETFSGIQFVDCPKFQLELDEYTIKNDNKSIYVSKYEKLFTEGQYRITEMGNVEICAESLGVEYFDKFGPYMGYVTIIGLGVSIVFLILHLLAFIFISELRNFSGRNLASLCLSLLLAYCFFILGQLLFPMTLSCVVTAALTYYFFLVSFFWMLVMAFDVWRTLRLATSELRVSAGKQWKKFTLYSFISWLIPAAIVLSAVFVDNADPGDVVDDFRPNFGTFSCWFGKRNALLMFFALPLAVVMMLNIIFFSSSAHMIYATTSTTRYTSSSGTQRDFRLYIRLALVMGLTWTVGLVAGYLDLEALWYAFIALNSLQGLFIFLAFTCTEKVTRAILDASHSCWKRTSRHRDGLSPEFKIHRPPSFSWSGGSSSSTHKSHLGTSSDNSSHHIRDRSRDNVDTLY